MNALFFYMLHRYRPAILFWGGGLAIVGIAVVLLYDSIADKQQLLEQLMEGFPILIKALAGDVKDWVTPAGWLHLKFFFVLPLSFGLFAVLTGAGLFAADEESGRLDLLMAYPVSRTKIFLARCAALGVATALITVIAWVCMASALPFSRLEIKPLSLFLPFLTLFLVMLCFQSLALLLSLLLASRIIAAGAAGMILIISFFLEGFAEVQPKLTPYARIFPLHYYQGGKAIDQFAWGPLIVLLAILLVSFLLAGRLFLAREIRVVGEGNISRKPRLTK
jgi:ABC-2 type transport system permease protein